MELKGSKTEANLINALTCESIANRRYVYFAAKADIQGYHDISLVFRSAAESGTGHASGLLEYLEKCGDPATGLCFGDTKANLGSAITSETQQSIDMYPDMAKIAREENFDEIADWFEILAKASRSHVDRFMKILQVFEK